MHRFRLILMGSDAAVDRAGNALEQSGGLPIGAREPSCWVWAGEDGLEAVEEFSRALEVPISFEGFEDFEDEIVTGIVCAGETTVQGRRSVLADYWGSFHDEDGQSLDPGLLVWAGSVIAARTDDSRTWAPSSGLDAGLAIGEEIGRFVHDTARDAPTERSLDAIARLARLALSISTTGAARTPGELSYLRPLRLTQAVVHAQRDEYVDQPGNADWPWWLGLLLSSTAGLIDDAHAYDITPAGPDPELVPGLELAHPGRTMEMAAGALVTSCVQVLALFGTAHPAFAGERVQ